MIFKDDVNCKCAELGYWLAEQFWGRGIMTAAVKEFSQFIFENYDIIRIMQRYLIQMSHRSGFWKKRAFKKRLFCGGAFLKTEQ